MNVNRFNYYNNKCCDDMPPPQYHFRISNLKTGNPENWVSHGIPEVTAMMYYDAPDYVIDIHSFESCMREFTNIFEQLPMPQYTCYTSSGLYITT